MSDQEPQPDLNLRIGIAVKRIRKQEGINQVALAKQVNVTQAYISQIENGKANLRININTLQAIAIALGLGTLSKLIERAEQVPPLKDAIKNAEALIAELT